MYPVTFDAHPELENRNRLTTFFRIIVAIPVYLVAMIYSIGALFAAFFAWLALLFTGRYPQGLYDFNSKVIRLMGRMNGYVYLLTDKAPPLNGNPDPSYPVVVDVAPPKPQYSRAKVFFRWLIGIPVILIAYLWAIIAEVCALLAWFAIIFTGKLPVGLAKPIESGLRYSTRATAYLFTYQTEDYPPFSDDGSGAPAGQLPSSQPTPSVPAPTPPRETA